MKRPTLILLGAVLLASLGGTILTAASYQPAKRSAEIENFHLVGPTGRSYSIESFPPGSVLAIYFGYTTCQRSCPTAVNSIAEAIDHLGNLGAAVQPVFIDMDPARAAFISIPAYMESFGPASSVSPVRRTMSSGRPRALRSSSNASNLVTTRPIM